MKILPASESEIPPKKRRWKKNMFNFRMPPVNSWCILIGTAVNQKCCITAVYWKISCFGTAASESDAA